MLTFAATVIELVSKFLAGAWLVALVIPLLVLLFLAINRTYNRIGAQLEIGQVPPPPVKQASLVVVPVSGMSRLTAEGVSVAMSLGDDVIAVTVVYTDSRPMTRTTSPTWTSARSGKPGGPRCRCSRCAPRTGRLPSRSSITCARLEADDKYHRLVVLIPEVEPFKPWEWILHNQRGIILERAIRRDTSNVVLCRLRYRLATLTATPRCRSVTVPK